MRNQELFQACTTQCIWCKEQWPIKATKGQMLHVGPYTQDPKLFSTPCKAAAIREAFEYVGYAGGVVIKWKARKPETLIEILTIRKGRVAKNGGLGRCIDSPKNRRFWRTGTEATLSVAEWPKWMRSAGGGEDTPPERLKECRDELRFFDEIDYWTRQVCTDGLDYRPVEPGPHNGLSNMPEPTCNYGFGCTTCWERYEKAYSKMSEAWCD